VILDRGGPLETMFTFVGTSKTYKKDHRRKVLKVTKKTLQIKDISTLEICCVNTTLMLGRRCAQEDFIESLEVYKVSTRGL
jgi:hypothetical protein